MMSWRAPAIALLPAAAPAYAQGSALLAFRPAPAPPAPMAGMRMLDTAPYMSLASTWNNVGSSFVPLSGCPR